MYHNQSGLPPQLARRHGAVGYYRQRLASAEQTASYTELEAQLAAAPAGQRTRVYNSLFTPPPMAFIEADFYCQTPAAAQLGQGVFINHNVVLLGTLPLTIGARSLIGPGCIITSSHWAQPAPVVIGEDVWLGANVLILPGSCIGDGCIVGAGSTVSGELAEQSRLVNGRRYSPSAAAGISSSNCCAPTSDG